MREKMKRAMGSLYWRQFMLSAGMVLLTMVLGMAGAPTPRRKTAAARRARAD